MAGPPSTFNFESQSFITTYLCPNPQCRITFRSGSEVQYHLSNTNIECGQWVWGPPQDEEDEDDDSIIPLPQLGDNQEDIAQDIDQLPPPATFPSFTEAPETRRHPDSISNSVAGLSKISHPNQSVVGFQRANLLQTIDESDALRNHRAESHNIFYPFASRAEWELARWLSTTSLPQAEVNNFLHLNWIANRDPPPSFRTAQDLRNRIEHLPKVPEWHNQEIVLIGCEYTTKDPMVLYWRDGLEVVKQLFANPVFANSISYDAYQLVDPTTGLRVYGDFMSAEYAWQYQSSMPEGGTMLGVIGASDKTPLTVGTGNREMHPVLLSLANIDAGVRMKATSHAFALAAYLPIPKFIDAPAVVQAALAARVFHACINIICKDLIMAEAGGVPMPGPDGKERICYTPLVSWIADLPEQRLIQGVLQNQSPLTTATILEFGAGPGSAQRRVRQHTLDLIDQAVTVADPISELPAFLRSCQALGLLGVHQPFWRDWGRADPSYFLTPDALHQWHKFFYDHVLKWVINIISGPELDRRLAALQPQVGERHWKNGISKLKQVTGREHRALQKVLVPVIAGAVDDKVLGAIRSMVDFIFIGQSLLFYDEHLFSLQQALREFHTLKSAIQAAGGRRGKKGVIAHWNIPKLELMNSVSESVKFMGSPYQWTSDITERCHITHVKEPYRKSNKRNFHEQCCRFMDRVEKCRIFHLYTIVKELGPSLTNEIAIEANHVANNYPEAAWISELTTGYESGVISVGQSLSTNHAVLRSTLFDKSRSHFSDDKTSAFTVAIKPHFSTVRVDDAARTINSSDLRAALGDYFVLRQNYSARRGARRSPANCDLPPSFQSLDIWNSFRMQQYSSQDPNTVLPVRTVQALPPNSTNMPHGRWNTVLVKHDDSYRVMQIRLIFSSNSKLQSPTGLRDTTSHGSRTIYLYGDLFKFSGPTTQTNEGVEVPMPIKPIDMFLLRRHLRSNNLPMSDVIPLTDVLEIVQLVPKFGATMDVRWNCDTSTALATEFYLNNFANKNTYHAILSYQ